MRRLFFIVFLIIFPACNFLAPPTPGPSEIVVIRPSATATLIPSQTPTAVLPTLTPVPTADPNFFRDDFNGNPAPPWTWVREDPGNWTLTDPPGALQITVGGGYVSAHTNRNLLLRPAPPGNFQIETQMSFSPRDNFQFAGLIIYESDSKFMQAGRGYCRSFECVREGLYMDYYKKGVIVKPDFGQSYTESGSILLRLRRRADTYTFEVSGDGKIWFIVGSHTSDMNPLQVGLVTGQRMQGTNLPATFDYFEVRSLP